MASTVKSTTLSFGMVTVPVAVKKVTDKREVGFQLASPAGNAVAQTYVDKVTGEIVGPSSDCKRGIFDDPKNGVGFHEVPAEALKAIDEAGKIDSIVIDHFVPVGEVPFERAEGAYFVAPNGKAAGAAAKPLALLRDGLAATGMAGVGKLTLRTTQRAFVVYAQDGGLLLNTLVFAEDFVSVAEAAESLAGVEVDAKTLDLAKTLIQAQAAEVGVLDAYTDDRRPQREALVAAALAGEEIEAPAAAEAPEPTVDLEAMLLASIGNTATAKKAAKPKAAKAKAA